MLIGGQAKTLMLIHINPELTSLGETLSTLKFAERVSSVELGAARFNKETGEIQELKEEVQLITCSIPLFKFLFFVRNHAQFYQTS